METSTQYILPTEIAPIIHSLAMKKTKKRASIGNSIDEELWLELYAYAASRVGVGADAEDLVQETCVVAIEKKESFAGKASYRSWLFGILRNKVFELYRHHSREIQYAELNDLNGNDFLNSSQPEEPSTAILHKQFWDKLKKSLAEMPKKLAETFKSYEIHQHKTAKVCKDLHISAGNMWVRLHRARNILQGRMNSDL